MVIVYQVGRLRGEKKTFFVRDASVFKREAELSSFVLKEYMKAQGKEVEVVLVYPVSIVLEGKDGKDATRLSCPRDYINEKPFEKERDHLLVVHSLGTYQNVELKGWYDDIVLELFFDMVKRYLDSTPEAVYFDISSGQNIYIAAMMEAASYLAIFTKLLSWAENKSLQIFTIFSDPIIGRENVGEYEIHIEKRFYDVSFTSPLISLFKRTENNTRNFENWLNIILKSIYNGDDEQQKVAKKSLLEKLRQSLTLYSSIMNSLPLCACYMGRQVVEEIKQEISRLIEDAEKKLYSNYEFSPRLNKEIYTSVLCQLAIYIGMIELLKRNNLHNFNPNDGIDLKSLSEAFRDILSKVGQNTMLLMNETDYFARTIAGYLKNQKNVRFGEWLNMYEILNSKPEEPHERNFFAHAGLERNITQVILNDCLIDRIENLSLPKLKDFIKNEPKAIRIRYRDFYSSNKLKAWLMSNL